MIKIAIQDSYIRDEHADKLIDACEYWNIPFECFGLIPFSDKITGDITEDKTNTIIPFGATKLIHLYNKGKLPANWKIFHTDIAFSQSEIAKENFILRSLLLNKEAQYYDFPECKDYTFSEDRFIKPDNDLKLFNAKILPAFTSLEQLFEDETAASDIYDRKEKVLVADLKNIVDEFRIFVVAGHVISKTIYKNKGNLTGGFSYKFSWLERFIINNLATIYEPDFAYVVDICTTQGRFGKNWHILEYNALQCSGFYNCNVREIIHALAWYYE